MRFVASLGLILAGVFVACSANAEEGAVHIIETDGTVGPIMEQYIDRALDDAEDSNAKAAVIELDTPGGLSSSMREIVQRIESSEVPVIVFVSPSGGRAASAGTFITMAGHIAAMAPNTSIGAASAINADGSDIDGTLGKKIENDAVAFIRGIAELRGRNADWAEQAVREAVAVDQGEAVRLNVVDFVANDIDDLLAQSESRSFELRPGVSATLTGLPDAPRHDVEMTMWEQFLELIADPTVASLLITFGFLGILFELGAPGFGAPGVGGTIAIVLGFLGLGVLPVETVGLVLMALGLGLLVAELFVPGGILGLCGVIALALGGVIAFRDTPSDLRPPVWLITLLGSIIVLGFGGLTLAMTRMRQRELREGGADLIGQLVTAKTDMYPHGDVVVAGQSWRGELLGSDRASAGERLRVVGADHALLHVRKIEKKV
jgi:membrane-bound serine protease (ClpP class)